MRKRAINSAYLVMGAGILLRFLYILLGSVEDRQYDPGSVDLSQNIMTGHMGYIYYLFTNKSLPDFDPREVYQFFHPPLHHILEAIELSICNLFTGNDGILRESLQILPYIYSVLTLFALYGICKRVKLKDKALTIAMAIFAFHPSLIWLAGSINNDCLSILFLVLSIYTTLVWIEEKTYRNIIAIAFAVSLGMVTKLSVSLMAFPIGAVFIYIFIKEWKEKGFPMPRFWQYAAFAAVCVPIGLSWAIRCYILFDMPLNYVNELPVDSWQYVGNYSLMERFFIPNPVELIQSLMHGSLGFGENMWMQLFRTAALGECDLTLASFPEKIVSLLMMAIAGLLALIAFYYFVRVFFSKKFEMSLMTRGLMIITYVVLFTSYVQFCVNYPHQCTMNFRYIIPTIIPPALALGMWMQEKQEKKHVIIKCVVAFYAVCGSALTILWIV